MFFSDNFLGYESIFLTIAAVIYGLQYFSDSRFRERFSEKSNRKPLLEVLIFLRHYLRSYHAKLSLDLLIHVTKVKGINRGLHFANQLLFFFFVPA